jgi:hypothetical protein
MNQTELSAIMYANVALIINDLTNDELAALNLVAALDSSPHGRLFDYEKVAPLFTEADGTRMHQETKNALSRIVLARLSA